MKPETVSSFELGYKGILAKKLLFDAYIYFSQYTDFLVSTAVAQAKDKYQFELYSAFSSTNVSYAQNSPDKVKALGWGLGIEYQLINKYVLYRQK